MTLMKKPVLVLNGSFEPVRIVAARRALTMICRGIALVEVPTDVQVHRGIFLPSVIRLRNYHRVPNRLQIVSRRNIMLRDGGKCLYCGQRFDSQELTLDHVIPRSRGGPNSWSNLVSCCKKDNLRKGDRTPEEAGMKLIHKPLPQTVHTPRFLLRTLGAEIAEWGEFLWTNNKGDTRYQFVN